MWQGSTLVSEYYGGKTLEFFYDESGAPYGFSYKSSSTAAPAMYYYVTNLQGDVTNVLDASGNTVASYTYNAWGKVLSSSGSMASINPLRYRGYYFDSDTGLYYLKSRYYDPQIARFVNADGLTSTGQGIVGCNMFAYCGNCTTMFKDSDGAIGLLATLFTGGIIIGLITALSYAGSPEGQKQINRAASGIYSAVQSAKRNISATCTSIKEEIKEIDEKHGKSYTVYSLLNPDTGHVEYVGRTVDFERRMNEHNKPGSKTEKFVPFSVISGLSYSEVRGLEQIGILTYNTLNASRGGFGVNSILGISPNNKNYTAYMSAAWDYIYNQTTNELYCLAELKWW